MPVSDMTDSSLWTPAGIQAVTRGHWLGDAPDAGARLSGSSIDSRVVKAGQLFIAVKGERFDGHDFVASALNAGAAMAIVERHPDDRATPPAKILRVDDTIKALHRIARAQRQILRQNNCKVIAVVGSNGKTTTRHMIHAVLSAKFKGTQSPKSFNNHLGVPLTLLNADPRDDFVVAEVGTNHPGEVAELGELLQPDAAVVTCIGREHLEFFGDLHGVAREEASILRFIPSTGGVFVEKDAYGWLSDLPDIKHIEAPVVFGWGAKSTASNRQCLGERQRFAINKDMLIDLPLIAPHDINNAQGAIAVGRSMGVGDSQIKRALESIRPMPGRLEVKRFGLVTVIDDTYNANPDSAQAALDVLAAFPVKPGGRRVAVLGDMLELGDASVPAHRDLGKALGRLCQADAIQQISLIGPMMDQAVDELAHTPSECRINHYVEASSDTATSIAKELRSNDVVLIKGSRGVQLERLLPAIADRFVQPPAG